MDSNVRYKEKNYWDSRYTDEECYEWFKDYTSFRDLIRKYVKPRDKILMLGCGNSSLSADMYNDGFQNIINVDYSEVCIHNMQEKHKNLSGMLWKIMDIRDLKFNGHEFDIILEKGTLDALLVDEHDRWQLSANAYQCMEMILRQCSRLLKNGGLFLSITFEQPMFRKRIYARTCFEWSVHHHTFGETGCLEYFLYCMKKGEKLSETDKEFECLVSGHRREWLQDGDVTAKNAVTLHSEENDIFNITV